MGVERTLQWFTPADYEKRVSCSARLEVKLDQWRESGNGVSRLFGEFENWGTLLD